MRSGLTRDPSIDLRVTERDFNLAHSRAREEGIPCQTLLSSVIHKYLPGGLTEKRQAGVHVRFLIFEISHHTLTARRSQKSSKRPLR